MKKIAYTQYLKTQLCTEIKISILTTIHVLNFPDPDTLIKSFGQLLTYHKLMKVLSIGCIYCTYHHKIYSKVRIIRDPHYKHINHNSSVGATFILFFIFIKPSISFCFLFAIIGGARSKHRFKYQILIHIINTWL